MKNFKQALHVSICLVCFISFAQAKKIKHTFHMVPKVDVYIVQKPTNLPIHVQYPAFVAPYKTAMVVSRASGILEKKYFKSGQYVKKGVLLYKIQDDQYKALYDASYGSMLMDKAVLTNALKNWNRVKQLFAVKATSTAARDNAYYAYQEAKARLIVAKANMQTAKINLGYTDVRAPISGVVGLKRVDVGNLVSATPPTNLIEITQNKKVYVNFSMPMSDYIKIKQHIWNVHVPYFKATLEVHGRIIKEIGIVDFIDTNINKATSTVKMRAVFNNSNKYLMAGDFVHIYLVGIIQRNAIKIPQEAVLQNPLGTIVFIVDNGHVQARPVVLGRTSGNYFLLKSHTLSPGTKVIVDDFFRLKPGSKVLVDKIVNH